MLDFLSKWLFTSKDLPVFEVINHDNFNLDTAGFSPASFGSMGDFLVRNLSILKNLNFGKWKYNLGDLEKNNFDTEQLEQFLFLWGKVAIWKVKDKFLFSSFSVEGDDLYPIYVKVKRGRRDLKLKVNKDVILIYSDSSFLFGRNFLGTAWRIFGALNELERINTEIMLNVVLSNNKITVPVGTNQEVKTKLRQEIMRPSPVIEMNMGQNKISGGLNNSVDSLMLRNETRTTELMGVYRWKWNQILEMIGISYNSEIKKERMIETESKTDNSIAEGINQSELKMRNKGIDKLNEIFGLNITLELEKNGLETDKIDEKKGTENEAN